MSVLAILEKQDSNEILQKLSTFNPFDVILLSSSEPNDVIKSIFYNIYLLESKITILSKPDIIYSNGHGKTFSDYSQQIPNSIFNLVKITIVAKTYKKSIKLNFNISDGKHSLGSESLHVTNQWNLHTVKIKTNTTGITDKIHIRVTNDGEDSCIVRSICVDLISNMSKEIINDLSQIHDITTVLTNSTDHEKITCKTRPTINTKNRLTLKNQKIEPFGPTVSIITPTYNGLKYIKKCSEHIIQNTNSIFYEWLVLDDGSTDGTDVFFKNELGQYSNIKYFCPEPPLKNFSRSNNFLAQKAKGKYLVLLNNDCYVQNGWLDSFIKTMEEDPTIGAVGSLLLFPETNKIQHCGVVFTEAHSDGNGYLPIHINWTADLESNRYFLKYKRLYQAVTAACCLVRKDIFDTIQGFDERYVFGYEDIDLCLRISKLGYKIVFDPNVVAYHEEGGTLKKTEAQHQMYLNNKKIFQSKWGHSPKLDNLTYIEDTSHNIYKKKEIQNIFYLPITRGNGHDIYRADHPVYGLQENNINTKIVNWSKHQWPDQQADAIVFQRFCNTPDQASIFFEVKHRYPNAKIGYDIDDYLFDEVAALNSHIEMCHVRDAHLYVEFMERCDFFTTTTTYLATRIRNKFSKPVFVIPNAVTPDFIQSITKSNNKIILGYASGSGTHNRDINTILPAIGTILSRYKNVIFRIMGHLSIPEEYYKRFPNQIEKLEFVPFSEFARKFAEFDINIAPLEDTEFNHSKSALKYIEAGALGIPTIASNTSGYKEIVYTGHNGFLCESELDWVEALSKLIENEQLRSQIGMNAKKNVLQNYTTKVVGAKLKTALQCITTDLYETIGTN